MEDEIDVGMTGGVVKDNDGDDDDAAEVDGEMIGGRLEREVDDPNDNNDDGIGEARGFDDQLLLMVGGKLTEVGVDASGLAVNWMVAGRWTSDDEGTIEEKILAGDTVCSDRNNDC